MAAPMCVSYLSFAYDIMIFVNGCRSSLYRLMDFLHHYENVSGQLASVSHKAIVQSIIGF